MKASFRTYLTLFLSTLKISAFTFGGGYVIVPLLRKRFVEDLKWIDEEEILDMISIAQSTPGPIAINVSVIIGYKIGGVLGSIISLISTILPPLLVITAISMFYEQFKSNTHIVILLEGMQAGVAAVICSVVYDLTANVVKSKNILSILIMAVGFIAVAVFGLHVALVIVIAALIGLTSGMIKEKRK